MESNAFDCTIEGSRHIDDMIAFDKQFGKNAEKIRNTYKFFKVICELLIKDPQYNKYFRDRVRVLIDEFHLMFEIDCVIKTEYVEPYLIGEIVLEDELNDIVDDLENREEILDIGEHYDVAFGVRVTNS